MLSQYCLCHWRKHCGREWAHLAKAPSCPRRWHGPTPGFAGSTFTLHNRMQWLHFCHDGGSRKSFQAHRRSPAGRVPRHGHCGYGAGRRSDLLLLPVYCIPVSARSSCGGRRVPRVGQPPEVSDPADNRALSRGGKLIGFNAFGNRRPFSGADAVVPAAPWMDIHLGVHVYRERPQPRLGSPPAAQFLAKPRAQHLVDDPRGTAPARFRRDHRDRQFGAAPIQTPDGPLGLVGDSARLRPRGLFTSCCRTEWCAGSRRFPGPWPQRSSGN
jgi:hypothetical protein